MKSKINWKDVENNMNFKDSEHDRIMNIINDFKRFDKYNVLVKTFTEGYCYDFAHMLYRNVPGSKIVFIKNRKHYVLCYNNRYYDITGEVKITSKDILEDDN